MMIVYWYLFSDHYTLEYAKVYHARELNAKKARREWEALHLQTKQGRDLKGMRKSYKAQAILCTEE